MPEVFGGRESLYDPGVVLSAFLHKLSSRWWNGGKSVVHIGCRDVRAPIGSVLRTKRPDRHGKSKVQYPDQIFPFLRSSHLLVHIPRCWG